MGITVRTPDRQPYAHRRYPELETKRDKQAKMSEFGGDNPKPRVFISFHIADEAQVNLLRSQAHSGTNDLEFTDYSVKEPFDEKWKTQCTERIKQSSIVVVAIGKDTHLRPAVLWEIRKAHELGKPVIGMRIYKDDKHPIPAPMLEHADPVVNWNLKDLQTELEHQMKTREDRK